MNVFKSIFRLMGRAAGHFRPSDWIVVIFASLILLALYWLTPAFQKDDSLQDTFRWKMSELAEDTVRRIERPDQVERGVAVVSINPLVVADLVVIARGTEKNFYLERTIERSVVKRIRYDNLILYGGIAVVLFLATWTFTRPRASVPNAASNVSLGIPAQAVKRPTERTRYAITAEAFLSDQVQTAAAIANALYDRSTLLIVGGIVMAFVGVGVFYATVPEMHDVASLTAYLARVVRPTGILIFVEAIAWFLLRQYRVQIEDYKSFYRIYLRRANLLIALKTIASARSDPAQVALAAAFLQDDQSGRLSKSETTESLAALATVEPNPVFDLFKDLVTQITPSKGRNKKAPEAST
jgi:hypothetical protein